MADVPGPSPADQPESAVGNWVIQRLTGDERELGRVVDQSSTTLTVDFAGVRRTWTDSLPKSAKFVDRGSLEWRALADVDALQDEFAKSPLDLVLQVLRELGPHDGKDLRHRLEWLRLVPTVKGKADPAPTWAKQWKTLQKQLRAHN